MRPVVCLLVFLAAALPFTACGDGGSADSPGGTEPPPPQPTQPRDESTEAVEQDRRARELEAERYGSPSGRSAPFSRYSRPGGLHLAEFGAEAPRGARLAAQAVLAAYLREISADRFAAACGYLHRATRSELTLQAAGSPRSQGLGCDEGLRLATADSASPSGLPDVASLRAERGAGFALLNGADGVDRWVAVKREGGRWRILSALPQPFR